MILAGFNTTTTTVDTGVSVGILIAYVVVGIAVLAFQIWFIVQMMKPSEEQYTAAGQNRTLWIVLGILSLLCLGCIGIIIVDAIWWFSIKPKIEQAGSGYGTQPPPAY